MNAVRRIHAYRGLMPLKSFADAIAATNPDFIVPGDDLATSHLHHLYDRERQRGKAGERICALIERSLGALGEFSCGLCDEPHLWTWPGKRVSVLRKPR